MSHLLNNGKRALAVANLGLRNLIKSSLPATTTTGTQQQRRNLNVHEYVGMKLLRENGVNVPKFGIANTPKEAYKVAAEQLQGE